MTPARRAGLAAAAAAVGVCMLAALAGRGGAGARAVLEEERFYTSSSVVGWPREYMPFLETHPGATPEQFFAAEAEREAASAGGAEASSGAAARGRAQQLVFVNHDSFAGYQGLPSQYMAGASWMDGSRGTEHLPHSTLKNLQAREAAAGIQGDNEGYGNYQSGEGLDMSAGGKPAPPVQALYQRVSHDADPPDAADDGVMASGGQPEAFVDMMDQQPYFELTEPSSEEQYFDTPPFATKGRAASLVARPRVARRQIALHAAAQLPQGLVSKMTDSQQAAQKEAAFMREAHSFLDAQEKQATAAPQDRAQDDFVAEARRFLTSGGGRAAPEDSPWPWEREERAADEDREEEAAMAAFEREARGVVGAADHVAMPPQTDIFFDEKGLTLKDWAEKRREGAREAREAAGKPAAGKALLLGDHVAP